MKLVLIGAGRAGMSLAAMLQAGGLEVAGVISRSQRSLKQSATLLSAKKIIACDLQSELPPADAFSGELFLLFAVPDDILPGVITAICSLRRDWSGCRAVHLSGAGSLDLLRGFVEKGALAGVLHPCVAISEPQSSLPGGTVYTYEGSAELSQFFAAEVRRWGGFFIEVSGLDRPLYHAGTVFCAGHLVALIGSGITALVKAGVSPSGAKSIALSVARGALAGLERAEEPADALTGPFARGDESVINAHREALRRELPEAEQLYQALGESSRRLLRQSKRQ